MESQGPHGLMDQAWSALLDMRAALAGVVGSAPSHVELVASPGRFEVELGNGRGSPSRDRIVVEFDPDAVPAAPAVAAGARCVSYSHARHCRGDEPWVVHGDARFAPDLLELFRIYLPIVVGAWHARREGRCFVTAHLAQSLDGRIACTNGHSQWIGNSANLVHAHRLRALHDAVVVGSRTLETDDPQLTVRHVPGPNPARVVLSASGSMLGRAARFRAFGERGATVVSLGTTPAPAGVDVLVVPERDATGCRPEAVRSAFARRGWHSAFVEGGARTISGFLADRAIDLLHLHFAPLILGSGVGSFALPEVASVREGRRFKVATFAMDGELLLECRALRGNQGLP